MTPAATTRLFPLRGRRRWCSNWPPGADSFNPAFTRSVDTLIRTNTPDVFAEAAAHGNVSEMPVFVVGMPRSGTTLVEQICASHSRIFGAGERDNISRMAVALARERRDPSKLAAASRQLADEYIVSLHRTGGGALRVVDKLPDNVVLVGLIARLFPRARIVYCSRDPRDISLSCYFQMFTEGAQYFSYDLVDCGRRCRDVHRLAAHWLKLLPLHMIKVNYETLVADLEARAGALSSSWNSTGSRLASISTAPSGQWPRSATGRCANRSTKLDRTVAELREASRTALRGSLTIRRKRRPRRRRSLRS